MLHASSNTRPLLTERPIDVKGYDVDFLGHVNNAVYVRWMEDLRVAFLYAHCPLRRVIEAGIAPVVHETQIRYLKPVKLFDPVVGRIWCSELGRATLVLHAEIAVDGMIYTEVRQRVMFIDFRIEKPARTPSELAEAFRNAMQEGV